jgi:hypothetical protein
MFEDPQEIDEELTWSERMFTYPKPHVGVFPLLYNISHMW